MLVNLHVKNLAIIDEVEVDFTDKLNIISGETGAGKSIIIGSINLALGGKVPKDVIRDGADYAFIELVFEVKSDEVCRQIAELDIPIEDGQVIISRKIMASKNISRINGIVVTNSMLKRVASLLIDIHGQHENQTLLFKKNHLDIVDRFAREEIGDIKIRISDEYREYSKVKTELRDVEMDSEKRIREASFLEYEIDEITAANLVEGEDETLAMRYKSLLNAGTIKNAISETYSIMSSGEDAVEEAVSRAVRAMNKIAEYDERARGILNQLIDIEGIVNDCSSDIADYCESLDNNDEEFSQVELRIDIINLLKSKYGKTISEINKYCENSRQKLDKLNNYENYIESLKVKLAEHSSKLELLCARLTKIRKKNADILVKRITKALSELNFIDVRFEMMFTKLDNFTDNGLDDAEFLISTNPGEKVKPLSEVASGGELSRVMLALKSVLADSDSIDTMIFDEIDAGISGRTAQKVSEKLSGISRNRQVLCITHLPQIAAMADTHFVIEKNSNKNKTSTNIRRLDENEAVSEIARIIGGAQITDNVLVNAKEMIELATMLKTA